MFWVPLLEISLNKEIISMIFEIRSTAYFIG